MLENENIRLQAKLDQAHEAYAMDMSIANDKIAELHAEMDEEIKTLRAELARIKPSWDDAPDKIGRAHV